MYSFVHARYLLDLWLEAEIWRSFVTFLQYQATRPFLASKLYSCFMLSFLCAVRPNEKSTYGSFVFWSKGGVKKLNHDETGEELHNLGMYLKVLSGHFCDSQREARAGSVYKKKKHVSMIHKYAVIQARLNLRTQRDAVVKLMIKDDHNDILERLFGV